VPPWQAKRTKKRLIQRLCFETRVSCCYFILISSIELANRFSPFSSDLPVSYSSTLISPFDPYVDFPQKSRVPYIDHKKSSPYMILPYSQHLFTIEMNRASIKSANELAHSYFPQNFHWIPEHSKKTSCFLHQYSETN
jgi:hypothetical protein